MDSTVDSELAIIVPAYRASFLAATLKSLAGQTDRRFRLYVFDDASPESLRSIFESVVPRDLEARFHRFDENLGSQSLAQHWNRCVRATNGEPWVWLLSDDDVANSQCVAAFYGRRAGNAQPANVCRFNTAVIDETGALVTMNPLHPPQETASKFVYHRLRSQRNSYVSEYIFRRAAFDQHNGFVVFPFALGSDDASWITFTADLPLVTIEGPLVYWRVTTENVSRLNSDNIAKHVALADFAKWITERLPHLVVADGTGAGSAIIETKPIAQKWLSRHLEGNPETYTFVSACRLATEIERRGLGSKTLWISRLWRAALVRRSWNILLWLTGRRSRPAADIMSFDGTSK